MPLYTIPKCEISVDSIGQTLMLYNEHLVFGSYPLAIVVKQTSISIFKVIINGVIFNPVKGFYFFDMIGFAYKMMMM